MEIILIRGKMDSGKTLTSKLAYDDLSAKAQTEYLFDHYNKQIQKIIYRNKFEVHDFKAVLEINGKIVVIITAGDDPKKLMKVLDFLEAFVNETFGRGIDRLICCGRSADRTNGVLDRLRKRYLGVPLTPVLTEWIDDSNLIQVVKRKTATRVVSLV